MASYPQQELYDDFELPLREYVFALARKWWVILSVFVVTVAVAFVAVGREPDTYEARTKLLITLPVSERVGSAGREGEAARVTPLISVQTLSALAVANDLLQRIIDQLDLKNAATKEPMPVESLAGMVEATVETSGDRQQQASLPILTFTVRGGDPDLIRRIANTWAAIFIRENGELFTNEAARSYDFLAAAYADVQKSLADKQEERLGFLEANPVGSLKAQFDIAASRYRDFLSRLRTAEADLAVAQAELAYHEGRLKSLGEAEARRNTFKKANPIEPLLAELQVTETEFAESLAALQDAQAQLVVDKALVDNLKAAVQAEPPTVTLTRGIPDESILQVFGTNPSASQIDALSKVTIRSQEPNPVYTSLLSRLRDTEVAVARNTELVKDLTDRTVAQKARIEELRGIIGDLRLRDDEISREIDVLTLGTAPTTGPSSGVTTLSLLQDLSNARAKVATLQSTVTDLSSRTARLEGETTTLSDRIAQADTTVAAFDRQISLLVANTSGLAQQLQDAGLAKAGQEGGIRVVESAIQPRVPVPKNTQRNLLLAGVLGLFMGVFAAFFIHWLQAPPASSAPPPSGGGPSRAALPESDREQE